MRMVAKMSEPDDLEQVYAKSSQTDSSGSEITTVTPGVYYPKHSSSNHYPRDQYRKNRARFVHKSGDLNIDKFLSEKRKIFSDCFVFLVKARWRWTITFFCLAFIVNWLIFAITYWIIVLIHGDLTENHLPQNQNASEWKPCIENIYDFTSTFLFSIEVHTTVAYGKRAITLNCPDAIFAMCLQCISSSIFQAFMVGILFAKLTRPKARTQTILFSKHAIVSLRDEKLCMIFRVGDIRKSRILNIKASMYVLRLNTDYQFLESNEQIELETYMDGCESSFFLWPVSVVHVIDNKSPLYKLSAADLLCGDVEILAVFEGIIESTGQPVQARSSFSESDIIWGHRFASMISYDAYKKMYRVDFSKLSETEQVDTPLCSANEYDNIISLVNSIASSDCSVDN